MLTTSVAESLCGKNCSLFFNLFLIKNNYSAVLFFYINIIFLIFGSLHKKFNKITLTSFY